MSPAETTRISNKLASLETEVRLKNEQNNIDHGQIIVQLDKIDDKLNTVIVDHEKRLGMLEGDVVAVKKVTMPMIDFRDKTFSKLIQFSLLGGLVFFVIYLIVRAK